MASTSVDLDRDGNDGFCVALEFALSAARGPAGAAARVPAQRDAGLDERIQRDAVVRLRAGATVNPRLLPLLADARYAPVPPGAAEDDVVGRALGVPDLVCLLAPPGVTRTRTVLEIVRAAAERGERVLIAAPTSAALDVLVSRLPAGPTVIRVDQGGTGPGTPAAAAAETQRKILARSQAAVHRLEPWLGEPSPAAGWLRRLTSALDAAAQAREAADQAASGRDEVASAARERLSGPVREAQRAAEVAERAVALAAESVDRLTEALRRAESSRFGWWRAGRLRGRLAQAVPAAASARTALSRARAEFADRSAELDKSVEQDDSVRSAADRAAFADLAAHRALESAERSAHQLTRMLDGVVAEPEWTADAAGMTGFAGRCRELEPVLRGRAALLREWRQRAARPTRQLHTELLRYADVLAATCLGIGRPEYGELEFDLVVVEDAGRVPVPAALVPLVRARRAILAGATGRRPGALTGSILDLIATRAPAANRISLS
ncbi:AAA domain-containing protein [Actinoplanes sp. NBC_00393]|uniref:AAA domain-containing protein n=1 Tax=Actinoplanes sp. NBC_00393 TaxID=2975953 RepID=UPI002E1C4A3D